MSVELSRGIRSMLASASVAIQIGVVRPPRAVAVDGQRRHDVREEHGVANPQDRHDDGAVFVGG